MNELYKIILVDDEDDVRGRVISKITEESGFVVVGKAGNGYDALELIEAHNPDVVITDIKMPFINGIELARIIRRDYPTVKVGFISGYDEFDFAREAIELNVISYMMKPITSDEVNTFLKKLKGILDSERQQIQDVDSLNKKYSEFIPKIIQSNLQAFSTKTILDSADLSNLRDLTFDCDLDNYIVCTIGLNDNEFSNANEMSVRSIIENTFKSFELIVSYKNNEGISFVVGVDKTFNNNMFDSRVFEVIKYIEEYVHIDVIIGVSQVFDNFIHFPAAFKESIEAKRHGGYYNLEQLVYYIDIINKEKKSPEINPELLKEFDYAIRFKSFEEIQEILDEIKMMFTIDKNEYIVDHQLLLINIANSLVNFSNMNTEDEITSYGSSLLKTLSSFKNSADLFKWFLSTVKEIREKNSKIQVNKAEKLIEDTFTLIEQNFSDSSLSLESVADELNISISYLSMLIKKKRDITFNKYLIKVRMEKAEELLKYTNEKILNISSSVGYNEVYYFSHSFKKYTGLSPREYREVNKEV